MVHTRLAVLGKVSFALLVVLACIRLAPYIARDSRFWVAAQPLYRAALGHQILAADQCASLNAEALRRYTGAQRLVVGSILTSLGCVDLAALVLPEVTTTWDRSELLAYRWGLIFWAQDNLRRAAAIWRQGKGIDQRLLIEARRLKEIDLDEAQRWYEAAIMSASSPQMVAESITAYSEELRGRIPSEIFRKRLAYLASYFGEDTAVGYRLRGEHALRGGSYQEAFELLSQAISLGIADAETWYLLGDAAWKLNDLLTTEQAYRAALNAPIQIAWRRPWHLNRLAALLSSQGRLDEAILFQEGAVRLSDYYAYTDNLAVLYAVFGQSAKAEALCARARSLAGSMQTMLRCEER